MNGAAYKMTKKKINGKKLLKNFVIALLGAIIGYLLYYSVIMDAIPLFIESSGIKYTVVSILALVILIAGCIAALNLIINKRVNKYLFFTMCVTYFAILFVALFFKPGNGNSKHNESCCIYPNGVFCAKAKIQQPFYLFNCNFFGN